MARGFVSPKTNGKVTRRLCMGRSGMARVGGGYHTHTSHIYLLIGNINGINQLFAFGGNDSDFALSHFIIIQFNGS